MTMHNFAPVDAAVVASPLTTPRLSPKRGGRTETIGCSSNAKSIAMIFNACEARTEVEITAGDEAGAGATDVTGELEALFAVGQALARLQDPAGRRRVLNWALQRFEAAPAENAAVAEREALTSDPTLVVGDLSDFFDAPRGAAARVSDGRDDPDDERFGQRAFGLLPARSYEETPLAAPRTPRLKLIVLHFVTAFRRVALGAGSPEAV
jgi:hypothetical protein